MSTFLFTIVTIRIRQRSTALLSIMRDNIIASLAACSLFALTAMPGLAQPTEIGIKGGVGLSDMASGAVRYRGIPSIVAGIYAPIPINPRLVFQPELQFATMGASHARDGESPEVLRTSYICSPLTLRLKIYPRFQVAAGLQPSFLLTASRENKDTTMMVSEEVRTFDLDFICGMSARIGTRSDLSVRYLYGLSTVLANDHDIYPKNRGLQLTLGLRMKRLKGGTEYRRRSFKA